MHYFAFCLNMDLHDAAVVIQRALGLPQPELRDGLNIGGGEYYRFLCSGESLYLIDNANHEVKLEDLPDADFYLYFRISPSEISQSLEDWLSHSLFDAKIPYQTVRG